MNTILCILIENAIVSSLIFAFFVTKARIRTKYIYTDNILVIIVSTAIISTIINILTVKNGILIALLSLVVTFAVIAMTVLFRFYRDPERRHNGTEADILAPADGFITYIKKLETDKVPFSIKGKAILKLEELTKVDILHTPCWLVGITMTLFDVHINRAPISGRIVLNKYNRGKFISLKNGDSVVDNERNTIVIENENNKVGVIQIASKMVRGIKSFVEFEQNVQMGERIGKINFGSQTDIIIPINAEVKVMVGQWVYGGKTILATFETDKG